MNTLILPNDLYQVNYFQLLSHTLNNEFTDAYSEPSQTSKIERFVKIGFCQKL